jgi:hypothetical protein
MEFQMGQSVATWQICEAGGVCTEDCVYNAAGGTETVSTQHKCVDSMCGEPNIRMETGSQEVDATDLMDWIVPTTRRDWMEQECSNSPCGEENICMQTGSQDVDVIKGDGLEELWGQ